jgi:acyl-coenzyme A thioesterase PaaI-like protein
MNGGVSSVFLAHEALQGYEGMLHGGVVSMLLDGAMTHCLFHRNIEAVTGDLRVRFLRPVPCKALLDIRAWVISATPPLFRLKAELGKNQVVMAWAEATFVQRNREKHLKT